MAVTVQQPSDQLPATGDWPGGVRYGLETKEDMRERAWTDAEKLAAYAANVRLPRMWTYRQEKWTDADGKLYGRWWWLEPVS